MTHYFSFLNVVIAIDKKQKPLKIAKPAAPPFNPVSNPTLTLPEVIDSL